MIPFKKQEEIRLVSDETMQEVYEKIKTPKKLGPVMKWEDAKTDCPSIFRWKDSWYMFFISILHNCDISGYETHLAKSSDLKNWEYLGVVLGRNDKGRWDSDQIAGYVTFPNIDFEGDYSLEKVNDHYYISYMGGSGNGYEPDPLMMGLVRCDDPTDKSTYFRFEDSVLSPLDPDIRKYEKKTFYKSYLFRDEAMVTGYKYVNAFNAKDEYDTERIYLAVSNDGEHWERYGADPIINPHEDGVFNHICGDPQILKMGDLYVMFYFRYERGGHAYNTFACSYDLEHWNTWQGEPLISSEYEWENVHAHKTWFIRDNGINYHFYCAVNDKQERFIALATSEE